MRLLILWVLLFLAANCGLCLVHIALFQSSFPFSAWASLALHVIGLIAFPYTRVFTIPQPK